MSRNEKFLIRLSWTADLITGFKQFGVKMRIKIGLIMFIGVFLSACGGNDCDPSYQPGIVLKIYDDENGAGVSCNAEIKVHQDGNLVEEVTLPSTDCIQKVPSVKLVMERKGRYIISVEAEGYETWNSDEVIVETMSNGCNVVTAHVDAWLTSSSP